METRCPKCGLFQDDGAPTCAHMRGRAGGRLVSHADLRAAGRASAAARRARGEVPPTPDEMRAMGKRGGVALRRSRGYSYFADIGRKGGATRRRQAAEVWEAAMADLLGTNDKEKGP